jgi:hypothetical protein
MATLFLNCNDIPGTDGQGDTKQRFVTLKFPNQFKSEAELKLLRAGEDGQATMDLYSQKHIKPKDYTLEAFMQTPEVIGAWTHIVLDAYVDKRPVLPDSVASFANFIQTNEVEESLFELIEVTGEATHFVWQTELVKVLAKEKVGMNIGKIVLALEKAIAKKNGKETCEFNVVQRQTKNDPRRIHGVVFTDAGRAVNEFLKSQYNVKVKD